MSNAKLRIATCQFSENWSPRRNASLVRRYIGAAAKRRCDVVHFHECALSGYGGEISSPGYDWSALREAMESVLEEARRHRIWVVLGSSHPLTPPHKPHNSLYLISPQGKIVDRYDKRFCTTGDLRDYAPGDHFVTFRLKGVQCGLLICYDLRFPEAYRELYRLKVRVVFQSFHNGRMDGPGVHEHIMRQTVQGHAGINGMWISAPNSSAHYSRWGSVFIGPDGLIRGRLPRNRAGLMVNEVDPKAPFYDAGVVFRDLAIRGVLNTGDCVEDPRSEDRTSL
jgi:predicted amidohydrolase